ncbi:hypothetical protein J6590_015810 [Homalodisca vitripennis]|nr:hypothetical protein J6590_015810 [Homalodisca vitripennis]
MVPRQGSESLQYNGSHSLKVDDVTTADSQRCVAVCACTTSVCTGTPHTHISRLDISLLHKDPNRPRCIPLCPRQANRSGALDALNMLLQQMLRWLESMWGRISQGSLLSRSQP